MKILITQETDWIDRYPIQQHHLAEKLSLRGHEIRVIDYEIFWKTQGQMKLFSGRQVFNNVFKIHPGAKVTVIRPGIIKLPWLDYISLVFSHKKEIDYQVKEFSPDVIIGFDILNAYLAMKIAKKNAIPFIYYWVDVNHRLIPFKPFRSIGRIVESTTLKQADQILTINGRLKDYVIKLGAPLKLTKILRTGVNIDHFVSSINDNTMRKKYKFGKDDVVLFFMGWLYDFSGLKEVVVELAKIKNEEPNVKLLIVGDGDAFDDLQKIREKHDMQDRMILAGKQPYEKIPEFLATADICLLPAYPNEKIMQDIVPIKMYEYMAASKPVISTRLPGIVEEFGENNGVIYINKPEETLKKAIDLIENEDRNEIGNKARKFVEMHDWNKITDEFEKILYNALKE